jgi:6-phosphogluconolactonase
MTPEDDASKLPLAFLKSRCEDPFVAATNEGALTVSVHLRNSSLGVLDDLLSECPMRNMNTMHHDNHHHERLSREGILVGLGSAVMLSLSLVGAAAANTAHGPGSVYTMSNDAEGNEILAYHRGPKGMLTPAGVYETGGLGSGGGLGNQGAVILGAGHRWLFTVNAGSNDISAFRVTPHGLMLTDVEPSLGELPVSLTVYEDLLYVLNAGGAGSIQGFTVSDEGDIMPIMDSMRPLSGAEMTGAAQIGFTPDVSALVVTEKATNLLDTYVVHEDGLTDGPFVFESNGQTPFGFDFTSRGSVLVSEAFGGAEGASAASSYSVAPDGMLSLISGSVPSGQSAACWLIVNPNSRYAYVTNTGSGTITGYAIDTSSDSISLLDEDGVTADVGEGTGPLDADFSTNGRFLYVLNSGTHEISVWKVRKRDGSLMPVQVLAGLPETANGMAAR